MRISIRKNDPGYHLLAHKCSPMLNGEEIRHCFTADEETGECFCYKTDDKDNIILNDSKTEIVEIVRKGDVKIIIPDEFKKYITK